MTEDTPAIDFENLPIPSEGFLVTQFITVRLTDAKAIDLRLLPVQTFQDMDISWWGYFLSPQGRLFSVLRARPQEVDQDSGL